MCKLSGRFLDILGSKSSIQKPLKDSLKTCHYEIINTWLVEEEERKNWINLDLQIASQNLARLVHLPIESLMHAPAHIGNYALDQFCNKSSCSFCFIPLVFLP